MSDQTPILHGYVASPFAEKAVLMLNLKVSRSARKKDPEKAKS